MGGVRAMITAGLVVHVKYLQACAQVGGVPVVHGSALFMRGETQSLTTATVATLSDAGEGASPLIVHYTSPPFANNEVGFSEPVFLPHHHGQGMQHNDGHFGARAPGEGASPLIVHCTCPPFANDKVYS